jgi:tail tube protein
MSYVLSYPYDIIKSYMFVEETSFATPPASPTFISAGPLVSQSQSTEIGNIKYRAVGSRDVNTGIKTAENYSFSINYNPIDTTLINYGISLPGGAGTIEKSLTFLKSQRMNNVENYILFKGCRTDSITVEVKSDGAVNVTQDFIASTITTPSTTHGLTGTPTFPPNPTQIPWTHFLPGAGPFTFNSVVVDTDSFSMTVNNNINKVYINGETIPKFVDPTQREITFSFDTFWKDTTLIADNKSFTARSMEYKLSTDKKLVFTNAYLEKNDTGDDTGSTDPKKQSLSGYATGVAIASY